MSLGYTNASESVVTAPATQGGIVAIYYLGTIIGTLLGGSIQIVLEEFEQ